MIIAHAVRTVPNELKTSLQLNRAAYGIDVGSAALVTGRFNQLTAADVHEYHDSTMNLLTTHGTSVASRASIPLFTTPIFEGPLDLLLHLIRANEVDIYDIPIAEITRQYLSYMELLEALDLGVAGEYLVIAATLIEIKSRLLLPQTPPQVDDDAEDPRAELVARLVEYQQFQTSVATMRSWEELRRQIFFRGAFSSADDYILPIPEGEADVSQLLNALHRMLTVAGISERPVTSVVTRKRLTLRIKMAEVSRRALAAGDYGIEFETLFSLPCPRYDIVITFLALLELLRIGRIKVEQKGTLAPIMLYAILERLSAAS